MTFFPKESYKASQKYLKILHWVGNILWKNSKERNISKESSENGDVAFQEFVTYCSHCLKRTEERHFVIQY